MDVYRLSPLTNIWQIQRKELLDEILGKIEEIWKIWVSIGHLFMILNRGYKLLTFDVKPASKLSKDAGDLGCLDLHCLQQLILDILFVSAHQLVFVVQENGHMFIWKYDRNTHLWQSNRECDLCNVSQSKVVSVCLSHSDILWCERRSSASGISSFCVCKRSLTIDARSNVQVGPVVALLHNCPSSTLYTINDSLFIFPKLQTTTLTCLRVQLQRKTVELYSGDATIMEYKCSPNWQNLDFSVITLALLHKLFKVSKCNDAVVATAYDSQCQRIVAITKSGIVYFITDNNSSSNQTPKHITLDSFDHTNGSTYHIYHKHLITTSSHHIRFYDKHTGQLVHEMPRPSGTRLAQPITSCPPLFPVIFDNTDIYFLQKSVQRFSSYKEKVEHCARELLNSHLSSSVNTQQHIEAVCKSFIIGEIPSERHFSDWKHFEDPALVLSILDQLFDHSPELIGIRQSTIETYSENLQPPHTDFSQIVDPYIKEYLKLEKLSDEISFLPKLPSERQNVTVENEIMMLIRPNEYVSTDTRRTQLEHFASLYPDRVLICLMKLLDVKGEELRPGQLEQWAQVLINDHNDQLTPSANLTVDFPLFDILCRLIFCVMPNQLIKFVQLSQAIHDRLIGVPAFMRTGQTLVFHERALSCLPDPSNSWSVRDAAVAIVHLQLTVNPTANVRPALNMFLHHHLWDLAIRLLQKHSDDSLGHVELFHTALKFMAQNNVSSRVVHEVLNYKPKQTTLATLLSSMVSDIDAGTCPSLTDVLCSQPHHVSIQQTRPVLLELAYKSYDE